MRFQKVEVSARLDQQGRWIPESFCWKGETCRVVGTGRRWEDTSGLHILVMIGGDKVFELLYAGVEKSWYLKPPRSHTTV
jgi:hypothetical protein